MRVVHLAGFAAFCVTSLTVSTLRSQRQPPPIRQLQLQNGARVADLLPESDTVLVLVYRPSDLFACASMVSAWQTRSSRGKFVVQVLVSDTPTALEARAMARSRVNARPVVNLGIEGERWKSKEYLFVKGQLVESSEQPKIGRYSSLARLM